MKLFKRLMTALLAGVLAVGMLAGCSGTPAAPNTPLPNDAEALALYQGVSETCKKYNVKTPVYCAELEPIAQEIAKAAVIHRYYTTQPSAAAINKAKADVSALMNGAEYLVYELNPYDTAAKAACIDLDPGSIADNLHSVCEDVEGSETIKMNREDHCRSSSFCEMMWK